MFERLNHISTDLLSAECKKKYTGNPNVIICEY